MLKELDKLGIPYCSEKSFEENPMGIGAVEDGLFTFQDVKNMDTAIIEDLLVHAKEKA